MNSCGQCKRLIGNETAVYVNKQLYHPAHLKCETCDYRIEAGQKCSVSRGIITCHRCHLEQHAPKCSGCHGGIEGPFVKALGRCWHPNCFKCTGCGCTMEGEWLNDVGIGPMHRRCYWASVRDTQIVQMNNSK